MKTKGLLYVFLACVGWGTIGMFVYGLKDYGLDSVQLAAVRCTISAIVLWIYMFICNRENIKISLKQLLFSAGEGVSFFAMAAVYFVTINKTSPATASLLLSIAPAIVVIFAAIFWKEKLTMKKIVAVLAALVGCGMVGGVNENSGFDFVGIMLGLLSALMYASYSICTKLALKAGMDAEANIAYAFLFAATAAVLFSNLAVIVNEFTPVTLQSMSLILGMSIVTGAFAGLMYTKGMKILPAGVTASFAALEPLLSTSFSVTFLNEKLTLLMFAGMLLILSAVTVLSKEEMNKGL